MLTIGDLSRANARRYPAKTALVMGEETINYRQLDERSNSLAHALLEAGVDAGDRVAILGFNSIEYAVVLQAVAKCGAMIVPLNFRYSADEVHQALLDAEPKVLFVEREFDDAVAAALVDIANPPTLAYLGAAGKLDAATVGAMIAGRSVADPGIEVDPASSAVILYTSGTTGRPKGVLYGHANYFRMFQATAIETRLRHDDVYLIAVPLFHAAGMNMALNQALFMGATGIIHRGRFEPDVILGLIERHRITLAILIPTTVSLLAFHPATPNHDLASLDKIFYGSMPIAPHILEQARKTFPRVAFNQIYGSTECGMVGVLRSEDHERWSQTTGREALLTSMRIVDEQGVDVAVGGVGEIVVDNRAMGMIGYWRNAEATRGTVPDGWIRSGDLARVEPEGLFTIVDRLKEVIISGGENIYPKEVEGVIAAHPAVREVAVFGIPDDAYGEAVCAAIAVAPGKTLSAGEVDAWCIERLARYKRPRRIEFHDALPRNASDKLVKSVLRAPHWQGRNRTI
jgi:acyl-CoA synthetase (AMP-forming)/AMP-acid ligase II